MSVGLGLGAGLRVGCPESVGADDGVAAGCGDPVPLGPWLAVVATLGCGLSAVVPLLAG